ncbi:MAG: hypothetical protein NT079_01255 [Candidatus Omnitrophica bacterium]|nr:hypothetical protein [Candidatus Omnitrophota bacterium]
MPNPMLVVADNKQNIFDLPGFYACGQAGEKISLLSCEDLIPLPSESKLFFLPDRYPVAYNIHKCSYEGLENLYPVAAFVPPGYTGLSCVAYKERKDAHTLPLFSYAPVAYYKGVYYVPAIRVDRRKNHEMRFVDWGMLRRKIGILKNTKNRLTFTGFSSLQCQLYRMYFVSASGFLPCNPVAPSVCANSRRDSRNRVDAY